MKVCKDMHSLSGCNARFNHRILPFNAGTSRVAASRCNMYWPALTGGYLTGVCSLMQLDNVCSPGQLALPNEMTRIYYLY